MSLHTDLQRSARSVDGGVAKPSPESSSLPAHFATVSKAKAGGVA